MTQRVSWVRVAVVVAVVVAFLTATNRIDLYGFIAVLFFLLLAAIAR